MNNWARIFKLKLTNFANPHGLVNKFNKSTAAEAAAVKFPFNLFRKLL